MYFPSSSWGEFKPKSEKNVKIDNKVYKLKAIISDSAATEGEIESSKLAIKRLEETKERENQDFTFEDPYILEIKIF